MSASPSIDCSPSPTIICLPDASGRLDADWLNDLRQQFGQADLYARTRLAAVHGLKAIASADASPSALLGGLGEAEIALGVLVLRSGLKLPPLFPERLAGLAAAPGCPPVTVFPGNYDGRVNPMAGLDANGQPEDIDSLVCAAGERRWTLISNAPHQALYLRPGIDFFALAGDSSVGLIDDVFIHDPDAPLSLADRQPRSVEVALGHVRSRVDALLKEGIEALPRLGHDGRPVTLHISHAWGGGIARWIDEHCQFDQSGHHLVLVAAAERDAGHYGQTLKLMARGPGRGLVQTFELTPSIADTAVAHEQYRVLLDWIIARYGVGRVIVSSLIGHALDCLRTGLPTAEVLHDFYPASPVLDIDPLKFADGQGGLYLAGLIAAGRRQMMFRNHEADHWRALRQAWREAVDAYSVRLIAPTRHVAERWSALFDPALHHIEVIPHGRSSETEPSELVHPRLLTDGRLSLVVVGRLSSGKGLGLLESALDQLAPLARITLVGAGKDAERLFGRAGVDVILNYAPDDLPGVLRQIGPQAALFLSTVPETWNYVLGDLRALGIPVLATRVGAFAERIDDGSNGILFEPTVDDLVEAVRAVASEPGRLPTLAAGPLKEPELAEVIQRYRAVVEPAIRSSMVVERRDDVRVQGGRWLAQAVDRARELEAGKAEIARQRADLARRTDWARRQERLAAERTRWAKTLDAANQALQTDLAAEQARVIDVSSQLDQQREQTEILQQLAENLRGREQALAKELRLIRGSLSWRLTRPLRLASRVAAALKAERAWNPLTWPRLSLGIYHSLRRHGLRASLLSLYETSSANGESESQVLATLDLSKQPVSFDRPEKPKVSIIIPVYNKVELTAACLHSLARTPCDVSFEVIVVDDCSSDQTQAFLTACKGVISARNKRNSGFIDTCNRGAELAHGEFLVFLNNDTTVTPGWLDALIAPFDRDRQTGIVGARLIYPDGRLQEAGGIIFSDGSGWNYGREQQPDLPQYGFLSEADYVSGACLAIRAESFRELGCFDTRFRPAYYEDTDLCFQVRAAGQKVIYQPASVVIHHEGATSGTDESSGAKRYQAVNRDKFREKWAELLADHPENAPDFERADPVRALRYRRKPKRVLVIDAAIPQPDHDSGSVRMLAMLTLLSEMGYQVSFLPENLQFVEGYSQALQQAGIEVLSGPGIGSIEDWLSEHGSDLDLVIGSRHYVLAPLLGLIKEHCKRAVLVFDTVDLHFLREEREAQVSNSIEMLATAAATRNQELGLIEAADITLVVSPVEQALLAELLPEADIRIVSNIHNVHGCKRGWDQRNGLMFVGGFQHVPNVDAALWLVKEIFPKIRALIPDIELHLIGSRMPPEVRDIEQPGVHVHGFVPELDPYLESCRVSLAPLRYGAGVKGKVNQAMSHGLPVVATTCAAEGMFLEHGKDVLVADSAEDFAAEVVRVHQGAELWRRLSKGGLANVAEHFSREAAARALATIDAEVGKKRLAG